MRRRWFVLAAIAALLLLCTAEKLVLAGGGGDTDEALQAGDKLIETFTALDESLLGEQSFGVFMNDFHIGWGGQKVEKTTLDGKDVYTVTSELHMKIADELEIVQTGTSVLLPNLTLLKRTSKESSRKSKTQKPEEETRDIALENVTYARKTTKGEKVTVATFEAQGPVISEMLLMVRKMPLAEGATYAFRVVEDKTEGKNPLARVTVLGKKSLVVAGTEQAVTELKWQHSDGTESHIYVDSKGCVQRLVKVDPVNTVVAVFMKKEDAQKLDEIVFKPQSAEEAQKDGPKATVAMLFSYLAKSDAINARKLFDMPTIVENMLRRRGGAVDKTDAEKWNQTVDLVGESLLQAMMGNAGPDMPGPVVFMVSLVEKIEGDKASVPMGEKSRFLLEKKDGLWKILDIVPSGDDEKGGDEGNGSSEGEEKSGDEEME